MSGTVLTFDPMSGIGVILPYGERVMLDWSKDARIYISIQGVDPKEKDINITVMLDDMSAVVSE
jgi:hypothetical protein